MPGPPFAFGAILVILALIVAMFIPENPHMHVKSPSIAPRRTSPLLQQHDDDLAETSIVLHCRLYRNLVNISRPKQASKV